MAPSGRIEQKLVMTTKLGKNQHLGNGEAIDWGLLYTHLVQEHCEREGIGG